MSDPSADVKAAIAAWALAWQERSSARLIALWDRADSESWFLPAGSVEPYIGPAIIGCLQRKCLSATALGYVPGPIHLRIVSDDVALCFFPLSWSEDLPEPTSGTLQRFGGQVRVTALLRRRDAVWRLFHYAEAPLAPLLELQAFYESVAADGLDAMPARSWSKGSR